MTEDEKRLNPVFDPIYAIENDSVIMYVVKVSFGLDLVPQSKSKVSNWGSFEPAGILPVAFEMLESDFVQRKDESRALSESGAKNLFARVIRLGIPGTRLGYEEMMRRDDDF